MSAPTNQWKLGAFVVGSVLVGLAAAVVLTAQTMQVVTVTYASYFDEAVTGLEVGSPVRYRGVKIGKPQYCLLPVTNRGVTFEPPCPLGEVIHRHGACNSRTTGTDRNFKRYLYSGVFGSTLPGALRLSLAQAACTLPLWQICSSVGYSLSYSNLEAARTAGARREHASSLSP